MKLKSNGSTKFSKARPAVEKVAPAVVRIVTALSSDSPADLANGGQDALRRYLFGRVARGHSRRPLERGLGSGVIVTEDGYILTNGHLVTGADGLEVTLQDGREFKAKVVGLDTKSDIAVIKIDAHNLPTVPLADSRKVRWAIWSWPSSSVWGWPDRDPWDSQRDRPWRHGNRGL